jgi:hypothetical protein
MRNALLAFLLLAPLAACSSSTGPEDGGGTDAATDSATGDAGTNDGGAADVVTGDVGSEGPICGDVTCQPSEVCVRQQFNGGALQMPDDAGMCPPGSVPSGGGPGAFCMRLPDYHCAPRPGACGGAALSCGCAGELCNPNGMVGGCYMCTGAEGDTLHCDCNAP